MNTIDETGMNLPIRPRKSLAEIAAEQGKGPVDFDELLKLGEFFPAEESVDDLIAFIRQSRGGDKDHEN